MLQLQQPCGPCVTLSKRPKAVLSKHPPLPLNLQIHSTFALSATIALSFSIHNHHSVFILEFLGHAQDPLQHQSATPYPLHTMNYEMEDTQNNAPGSLPSAQASKLAAPRKGPDAHSTTKRYDLTCIFVDSKTNAELAYKPS